MREQKIGYLVQCTKCNSLSRTFVKRDENYVPIMPTVIAKKNCSSCGKNSWYYLNENQIIETSRKIMELNNELEKTTIVYEEVIELEDDKTALEQIHDLQNFNDQKIKADNGKLELSLVPTQAIKDIAEVRQYGNKKYTDSESWRRVRPQRYVNALYRHLLAIIEDPTGVDQESGIEHYKHLVCNAAFLCELFKKREHE